MRLTVQQGKSSAARHVPLAPGPVAARRGRRRTVRRRDADAHGHGRRRAAWTRPTPRSSRAAAGLFPAQLLTAYGITPLQAAGFRGQGVKLAIVGSGPTPTADVNQYRSCFGFDGTPLKIHGGSGVQPIIESSLDAMVVSMVAPQLDRFDLWVRDIDEDADDGDVLGFLKMLDAPLQATANGTPLPDVVSVSYGVCEPTVSAYTASRTLVKRTLAAEAALGITVVVAAGDAGSSSCAHGVPRRSSPPPTRRSRPSGPRPRRSCSRSAARASRSRRQNAIAASGPWNDTVYPAPFTATAGGRRRAEHVRAPPVVAAGAVVRDLGGPHGARTSPCSRTRARAIRSCARRGCRAAPRAAARRSPSSAARARPPRWSRG